VTTPGNANTSAAGVPGQIVSLPLVASTPPLGYVLANGTGNILQWTPPNDGQQHYVQAVASMSIVGAETGGAIELQFNTPDGATYAYTLFGGSQGAGFNYNIFSLPVVVQGGQPVQLIQASALTAGGAKLWAGLFGY
jgi:hypothetical protein